MDTGSRRSRAWTVALALAAAAFGLNLAIAHRLEDLRTFNQYDLFFNADVAARLRCMVENDCGDRSSFAHPNLPLFLNPPVQLAAAALASIGLEEKRARRLVAVCVSPAASAAKASVVYFALLGLGLGALQAGLLTLLGVVSFSQLVFGSLPESFAVSGLAIALAYLLATRSMQTGERRLWPWVLVGILLAGITVSNIAVLAILFAAASLQAGVGLRRTLASLALVVGLVLAPTAALPAVFGDFYRMEEVDVGGGARYARRWLKPDRAVERALATPSAWAHTFAAPEPGVGNNLRGHLLGARYPYRFVTAHREDVFCLRHPLGMLLVGLFALGALGFRRAPSPARWLCGASLAILGFNGVLHAFWGVDLILYSQHWQLSLLVLLAGLFFWSPSAVRGVSLLLCGLLLAVLVENAMAGAAMESKLRADHRGPDLESFRTERRR